MAHRWPSLELGVENAPFSSEMSVGPRGPGHSAAREHGEKTSKTDPLMDSVQKTSPITHGPQVGVFCLPGVPQGTGAEVPSLHGVWGPAHCRRSSEKLWPDSGPSWCPGPPGPRPNSGSLRNGGQEHSGTCVRRPHPPRTGMNSQFSEDRCLRCTRTRHLGDGFISRSAYMLSEGRTQGGLGSSRLRRRVDFLLSPDTLSWPSPWVCSPGRCAVTAWAARRGVRPCQGLGQTCTSPTSRVR